MPTQEGQIYKLMAAVLAEDLVIPKSQRNTSQNYNFRGVDDTYIALKPLLAKHGIFVAPEVIAIDRSAYATKGGTEMVRVILTVRHTFYAPDGSSVSVTTVGEGADSGDKASPKAMSCAYKYALWEAFMVPTEEPKDAENDSPAPAVARAERAAPAPAPVHRPAPKAAPKRRDKSETPRDAGVGETGITFPMGKNKGADLVDVPIKTLLSFTSDEKNDFWEGGFAPLSSHSCKSGQYAAKNKKLREAILAVLEEADGGGAAPAPAPASEEGPPLPQEAPGDINLDDVPF